jgi:prepilin signal peptidase PulO-like enzyme (type II secretory pathway)
MILSADLPFTLSLFFACIFGLLIGSFLNVVIYRIPRAESVVYPGSHCPGCGKPIRAFDNIPLLSYVLLRGRCRDCNTRISPLYPTVELLTALLFVAVIYKTGPNWEAVVQMIFACVMLVLIFIDLRHHLLPNVIIYPAFVFALAAATARGGWGEQIAKAFDISLIIPAFNSEFVPWRAALIGGALLALAAPGFWLMEHLDLILFNKYYQWEEMNEESEKSDEAEWEEEGDEKARRRYNRVIYGTMIIGLLLAALWAGAVFTYSPADPLAYEDAYNGLLRASVGALIGGGLIWWLRAIHMFVRGYEGMGLGDVKMMSIVGAFLGWQGMFGVLLLGSILGSVVGVVLAVRSKRGLKTALPFGVCLGIASLIVMLR